MSAAERIPSLDDAGLANLRANAARLAVDGDTDVRRQAAQDLIPLIEAELAARDAARPPKPARKPRAPKAPAEAA